MISVHRRNLNLRNRRTHWHTKDRVSGCRVEALFSGDRAYLKQTARCSHYDHRISRLSTSSPRFREPDSVRQLRVQYQAKNEYRLKYCSHDLSSILVVRSNGLPLGSTTASACKPGQLRGCLDKINIGVNSSDSSR